jgi:hypothetical protein
MYEDGLESTEDSADSVQVEGIETGFLEKSDEGLDRVSTKELPPIIGDWDSELRILGRGGLLAFGHGKKREEKRQKEEQREERRLGAGETVTRERDQADRQTNDEVVGKKENERVNFTETSLNRALHEAVLPERWIQFVEDFHMLRLEKSLNLLAERNNAQQRLNESGTIELGVRGAILKLRQVASNSIGGPRTWKRRDLSVNVESRDRHNGVYTLIAE